MISAPQTGADLSLHCFLVAHNVVLFPHEPFFCFFGDLSFASLFLFLLLFPPQRSPLQIPIHVHDRTRHSSQRVFFYSLLKGRKSALGGLDSHISRFYLINYDFNYAIGILYCLHSNATHPQTLRRSGGGYDRQCLAHRVFFVFSPTDCDYANGWLLRSRPFLFLSFPCLLLGVASAGFG